MSATQTETKAPDVEFMPNPLCIRIYVRQPDNGEIWKSGYYPAGHRGTGLPLTLARLSEMVGKLNGITEHSVHIGDKGNYLLVKFDEAVDESTRDTLIAAIRSRIKRAIR